MYADAVWRPAGVAEHAHEPPARVWRLIGDGGLPVEREFIPDEREAQSPARRADELSLPLFIVHGKDDFRAAFEHAEVMRDALDEAGKPYEWLVKDKEEHGFYTPENTVELFERVEQFFGQHLSADAAEEWSLE